MPLLSRSAREVDRVHAKLPAAKTRTSKRARAVKAGTIRVGIGGWTFEPWRGAFYPKGLPHAQELSYASRCVTTIEINGTFYRTQTPATFAKWAREVPEGFVFSVKAPRAVTMRRELGQTVEGVARFLRSGLAELVEHLGPILWQLAPTHRYDPDDLARFLDLLPAELNGLRLRHALEVRHASFETPDFVALMRQRRVAVVDAEHATYPEIADVTSDFVYARLQKGEDGIPTAYPEPALDAWANRLKLWAKGELPRDLPRLAQDVPTSKKPLDVFAYVIHEGKVRAPAAAEALIARL